MERDIFFVKGKNLSKKFQVYHILDVDQWVNALIKPFSPTWFLFYIPNSMLFTPFLIFNPIKFVGTISA